VVWIPVARPNGPRISCGDLPTSAQSYVSFRPEAGASRMRRLGGGRYSQRRTEDL
jgi:hypothetical protein